MLQTLSHGRHVHTQFLAAEARRRDLASVDPASWSARQLEAVRQVWADAAADVPYYASLVRSGGAPRDIASWDDLRAIPVLTRQLLQERPSEFLRRSGPPATVMTTAGSTGTPLRMGMAQPERDLMRVVKLASWQALGYTRESKLFLIWGHSHLLGTGLRGRYHHIRRKLADVYLGYRRVDAYRLNRHACEEHAEALLRFAPTGLIGYASALDLFARYTGAYRDRFRALGMRFVLITAEPPPRADTVALLEDLFGCPVVQEYGGAEFGQVAFKTGTAPFESYPDLNYVECEPGEAEQQPLLLTSLYPRYLPLIRYRVGDTVSGPEVLPHGHVARFQSIGGRVNDVILLADGDAIHSVAIFHCIHQEPLVYNIQMVVRDSGFEIRLVAGEGDRAAMESRIRGRLAQVHQALEGARFTYVEDLATTRAGKRRWYVDERSERACAASQAS